MEFAGVDRDAAIQAAESLAMVREQDPSDGAMEYTFTDGSRLIITISYMRADDDTAVLFLETLR